MYVYVELSILHQETATQQSAKRSELGKFLTRVSNFRRHHQVVYCLVGQKGFNVSPLALASMGAARRKTRIDYSNEEIFDP